MGDAMRWVVIALAFLMPSAAQAANWPMLCADFLDVWPGQIEADGDPVTKPGHWVFTSIGPIEDEFTFSVGTTGFVGRIRCASKYVAGIDLNLHYVKESSEDTTNHVVLAIILAGTIINTMSEKPYVDCVRFAKATFITANDRLKTQLDRGEENPSATINRILYGREGPVAFHDGPSLSISISEINLWFSVTPPRVFRNGD
jgi:hypothetical protein